MSNLTIVSLGRNAFCAVLLLAGSGHHGPQPTPAAAHRVPFVGLVSAVDVPGAVIVLAHDALSGYGPAGQLRVHVDDAEALERFVLGDRVRATMILAAGHDVVLEHVVVTPRGQSGHERPAGIGSRRRRIAAAGPSDPLSRGRRGSSNRHVRGVFAAEPDAKAAA